MAKVGRPLGRKKIITLGIKVKPRTKRLLLELVELYVKKGRKRSQSLVIEDALNLMKRREEERLNTLGITSDEDFKQFRELAKEIKPLGVPVNNPSI